MKLRYIIAYHLANSLLSLLRLVQKFLSLIRHLFQVFCSATIPKCVREYRLIFAFVLILDWQAIDNEVKNHVSSELKNALQGKELPLEDLYNDVYVGDSNTVKGCEPFDYHDSKSTFL